MDYIYAKLDNNLVDINRIDYIKLKKCDISHEPIDSLEIGDYYLETKIVDSDKLIYTDLSDLNTDTNNISSTLEQEIKDRIEEGIKLQTNIDNESKRTDNMINQLNENVHSQFTQLNKILVDSINTINGGIEEERQIRDKADKTLQSNLDAESKRVDSMINTVNNNVKTIVDQLNQNIITIVTTINTNLDNESKERLKQDTILDERITKEINDLKESSKTDLTNLTNIVNQNKEQINERVDGEVALLNSTISSTKQELQSNIDAVNQDLQNKYEYAQEAVASSVKALNERIDNEKERATTAETTLQNNIDKEVQDRKNAISSLSSTLNENVTTLTERIATEETRAKEAEATLDKNIKTETAERTNAITEVKDLINQEVTRATKAETTLSGNIATLSSNLNLLNSNLTTEIADRKAADATQERNISTVSNNLQIETNRASQAEENLHTEFIEGIAQEKQERINSDNALSTRIDNLEGKTTRLYYGEGTLSSPTATEIQSFITELEVDPPYAPPYSGIAVVVKLTDENTYHIWHYYSNLASWKDDGVDLVNTFTNNTRGIIQGTTSVGYISAINGFGKVNGWEDLNSTVSNNYDTLNDKIDDSVSTINTTISSLSTRLDTKIDAVDDKLDQEINDRTEAVSNLDTELTADIEAEKEAREQADNTLTSSLTQEISDRKAADTNLTNTELRFTKSTGTTMAVGGIAKGTTFSNKKLVDIINEMLYPYVSFSISGFTLSPNNGGTFENGSTITLSNSTTNVTLGSESITRVTVYDGASKLGEKTSALTGNSFQVPITLSIKNNKTLKTEVEDAKGTILSRNSSAFTFVYPFYYGSLTNGVYDEASVKGLTKVVQSKGSKTFRFTHSDKCCVIAYPSSYGNLRTVIDQNNFDVTSAFTQHTVSITGLDGTPVNYYVYTNSPATLDNFGLTFNF